MNLPESPSEYFKRRNPHIYFPPGDSRSVANVEPSPQRKAARPDSGKTPAATRFLIRVESIRKRGVDCEGLCCKYLVDCLRYSGVIPDDTAEQATIEIQQRKATENETERTIVEVFRL
jgi:hypothetical protein